jgi:hypothetical protein
LTVARQSAPAEAVWLAGQLIVGGVVSVTVTVKLQVAARPAPSVAVQVTVVAPNEKAEPEGGVQTTLGAPQLSLAVGAG